MTVSSYSGVPLAVGLLDFGTAGAGESFRAVVDQTVATAVEAERLGYARYWLAEHHQAGCAWGSPEIMLSLIGEATERMAIGSGGILFRYANPLRLGDAFTFLAQRHPGRVELGLASGGAGVSHAALLEGGDYAGDGVLATEYRLAALISYLGGHSRPQHTFMGARVVPEPTVPPKLWMLGVGMGSATTAAKYGIAYAHSIFHTPDMNTAGLTHFVRTHRQPANGAGSNAMIAIAGVCAETDELARSAASEVRTAVHANVVGTPDTVAGFLAQTAARCGVENVLYLELSQSATQRHTAIQMLADALGLQRGGESRNQNTRPAPSDWSFQERGVPEGYPSVVAG